MLVIWKNIVCCTNLSSRIEWLTNIRPTLQAYTAFFSRSRWLCEFGQGSAQAWDMVSFSSKYRCTNLCWVIPGTGSEVSWSFQHSFLCYVYTFMIISLYLSFTYPFYPFTTLYLLPYILTTTHRLLSVVLTAPTESKSHLYLSFSLEYLYCSHY